MNTKPETDKHPAPPPTVVMGVCGCGKTTIGALLGRSVDAVFVDGDALHPKENVDKMASGIPLNDEDRRPWLREVGKTLGNGRSAHIVACSALKRRYREEITQAAGRPVFFLLLTGSKDVLSERMKSRAGHFMPPALLDSQLETLEIPAADEFAAIINGDLAVEEVFDAALRSITAASPPTGVNKAVLAKATQ